MRHSRNGYTVCELVVILAVNTLLLCLLVPTINRVRHAATEQSDTRTTAAKAREFTRGPRFARPVSQPSRHQPEQRKKNAGSQGPATLTVSDSLPRDF